MLRVNPKGLPVEFIGFLELVGVVVPNRQVVAVLKGRLFPEGFLGVVDGRVKIVFVGLDNCDIVERFDVIGPMLQCIFVGLDCEISLAKHGVDIPYVVPEVAIGEGVIFALDDSPFEAGVEEVVLMVGEAAEGHVVP